MELRLSFGGYNFQFAYSHACILQCAWAISQSKGPLLP
jgi:hypothetical protein